MGICLCRAKVTVGGQPCYALVEGSRYDGGLSQPCSSFGFLYACLGIFLGRHSDLMGADSLCKEIRLVIVEGKCVAILFEERSGVKRYVY
jgi:hypothetical protein